MVTASMHRECSVDVPSQQCDSAQALGISLKLTLEGDNQFGHPQLYFCILVRLTKMPV